jgi:hypothetical protein
MELDVDDILGWVGEGDSKMAKVFREFALSKWLVFGCGAGYEDYFARTFGPSTLDWGVRNALHFSKELIWDHSRDYA